MTYMQLYKFTFKLFYVSCVLESLRVYAEKCLRNKLYVYTKYSA